MSDIAVDLLRIDLGIAGKHAQDFSTNATPFSEKHFFVEDTASTITASSGAKAAYQQYSSMNMTLAENINADAVNLKNVAENISDADGALAGD